MADAPTDQPQRARIVGAAAADDDVLRVEHIAKRFGPITALRDINLHLRKGEVLGLLGDNGAGKSTLIKILCGFQKQDSGTMWLQGRALRAEERRRRAHHGIDTVYQDLALIDELSVYHNLFLRRERVKQPIPFLANAPDAQRGPQGARRDRDQHPAASTSRSRGCRAASARRSRSRARSPATPTSSCSTSRSRRWAPKRAR